METLGRILASWEGEFASPHLFWITGALALICIFFPVLWKRNGIRLDLAFWKKKIRFRGKASWIMPLLIAATTLLLAASLADPQILMKRTIPIYGKPALVVVDVSGSMGYVGRRGQDLTGYEKAHEVLNEVFAGDLEADFGLLFFSSENYIARYFASKKELLRDTLEVTEEIREISYGTRAAEALALARRFLSEKVQAKARALVLISDLQESPSASAETALELEKILKAGIKVYVILMVQETWWEANKGAQEPPIQLQGLDIVEMDDGYGISRIRREIASMASSAIKEETVLSRTSLIPYLIPPLLGLVALCLVLSETYFRRIP
jgi:hypothetical protein